MGVNLWFLKWHKLRQAKHEIENQLWWTPSWETTHHSTQMVKALFNKSCPIYCMSMCKEAKFFSHQILLHFQQKKLQKFWNFFFLLMQIRLVFLFFGKLICQIFYCKILKKETLLQGESKPMSAYISSY